MQTTLSELSKLVGGVLRGDPSITIIGANPLQDAAADEITLVDSVNRVPNFLTSKAAAAIMPVEAATEDKPCIVVEDIHAAFQKIILHFRPARAIKPQSIHPNAIISPSAKIGAEVAIGPGTVIEDDVTIGDGTTIGASVHIGAGCSLGENITIHPRVVLYEDCVLGDRIILHAGVVVGSNGFGYQLEAGKHLLSSQLGNVILGADVEIGANTTVDRGAYGPTVVGEGTKIDNLVQIAHNCHIGKHNLICAQVGIAGSSSSGDYVVMAGQVGIRDHVHVGNQSILCAKSAISNNVPDGSVMLGIPATQERAQKIQLASLAKLPTMRKEFRKLKQTVEHFAELLEADNNTAPLDLPIKKASQTATSSNENATKEDAA